jgi:ribose 1,5-bisphosphokinase PhnN
MGVGQPGSTVQGGGGGSAEYKAFGFRDVQDAQRSGAPGSIPSAAYPDGYLGTIVDRQQDKLLTAVQSRLTQRSYQRGVHKGERVDARDYYWTPEVNPQIGLEYEAKGLRWTAQGDVAQRLAHGGKNAITSPSDMAKLAQRYGVDTTAPTEVNPIRAQRLQSLRPTWR